VGKGAKIAIGCGVVLLGLLLVAGIAAFLGVSWIKGKAEGFTERTRQTEDYKKKANANAFVRPVDGVISEERLVRFIEVRKAVFAVYEKNKDLIESHRKRDSASQPTFKDVTGTVSLFAEILAAQAKAQAEAAMSDDEYRFMIEAVYKSGWAAEFAKGSGGKSLSQVTEESVRQAGEELQKAEDNPALPEEARRAMREAREKMASDTSEARASAKALEVPAANIELFRKYETDLKKYAMTGLEAIGL
jgi:hypothetical protein